MAFNISKLRFISERFYVSGYNHDLFTEETLPLKDAIFIGDVLHIEHKFEDIENSILYVNDHARKDISYKDLENILKVFIIKW